MAINSYDDNKITKGGSWVTIMKASCIMSFKPHVRARLNSIFVACGCGSLLVYPFNVFSRTLTRKTQIIFSSKIKGSPQRLSPSRSSIEHGGTRPFFYMGDQYFGNDSLEPFES